MPQLMCVHALSRLKPFDCVTLAEAKIVTTSDLAITRSPKAQDVKPISEEDLISLKSLVLNADV